MFEENIRIMKRELDAKKRDEGITFWNSLQSWHQLGELKAKIKENTDKIAEHKKLPYLISNIIEVLSLDKKFCCFLGKNKRQLILLYRYWN